MMTKLVLGGVLAGAAALAAPAASAAPMIAGSPIDFGGYAQTGGTAGSLGDATYTNFTGGIATDGRSTFARESCLTGACGTIRDVPARAAGADGDVAAGFSVTALAGAVPESATWAMMMIGVGMMGFALRRRARVATRVRFA